MKGGFISEVIYERMEGARVYKRREGKKMKRICF
jgi:hypothetical protein